MTSEQQVRAPSRATRIRFTARGRLASLVAVALALVAACQRPEVDASRLGGDRERILDAELALADVPGPDLSMLAPHLAAKIRATRARVEADRGSAEAWGRLGMVLQAHEFFEEAGQAYRRAASLDTSEFRWPYLLGQSLAQSDLEESLLWIEQALEAEPEYVPAKVIHGGLLRRLGRPVAARTSYEQALAADPDCAAASVGLGQVALAEDDAAEALEHLDRAARLQPNAVEIHRLLVNVHKRLGNTAEMARAGSLARQSSGELSLDDPVMVEMLDEAVSSKGYRARAFRAEMVGDLEEAERLYRKALEIRPEDAANHYGLARLLTRRGQIQRAQEGLRRALEIEPRHADALVDLGTLLAFQPSVQAGALRESIALLEEAGRIRPGDGLIDFHLAVAQSRLGDYGAAWEHVQAAQQKEHEVPEGFVEALRLQMPAPESG